MSRILLAVRNHAPIMPNHHCTVGKRRDALGARTSLAHSSNRHAVE